MKNVVQYIRSLFFVGQMYLMMALMAIWFTPQVIFKRQRAYNAVRCYCHYVRWSARWMVGLHSETRGPIPQGEVLIAAKHQSFFDIIILVSVLSHPKFIMKKELVYAPILGWYAQRIGCVPIERGKKRAAIEHMLHEVEQGHATPGQLVIYPQGTRVAPGNKLPYKMGAAILYQTLAQSCIPVATNVGVFWPRRGIMRKPGVAVVEFLDPIAPGQALDPFLSTLENVIETRSDQLMHDAGWTAEPISSQA